MEASCWSSWARPAPVVVFCILLFGALSLTFRWGQGYPCSKEVFADKYQQSRPEMPEELAEKCLSRRTPFDHWGCVGWVHEHQPRNFNNYSIQLGSCVEDSKHVFFWIWIFCFPPGICITWLRSPRNKNKVQVGPPWTHESHTPLHEQGVNSHPSWRRIIAETFFWQTFRCRWCRCPTGRSTQTLLYSSSQGRARCARSAHEVLPALPQHRLPVLYALGPWHPQDSASLTHASMIAPQPDREVLSFWRSSPALGADQGGWLMAKSYEAPWFDAETGAPFMEPMEPRTYWTTHAAHQNHICGSPGGTGTWRETVLTRYVTSWPTGMLNVFFVRRAWENIAAFAHHVCWVAALPLVWSCTGHSRNRARQRRRLFRFNGFLLGFSFFLFSSFHRLGGPGGFEYLGFELPGFLAASFCCPPAREIRSFADISHPALIFRVCSPPAGSSPSQLPFVCQVLVVGFFASNVGSLGKGGFLEHKVWPWPRPSW